MNGKFLLRDAAGDLQIVRISDRSGIPLIGTVAFGVIDRGTSLIQVRPSSSCSMSCIFCSTDAGPRSRTRAAEYLVDLDYLLEWYDLVASIKVSGRLEAHVDTVGDPFTYPRIYELFRELKNKKETAVVSTQTHGILLGPGDVERLEESGVDRVNLSIDSLNPAKARLLAGTSSYDVSRVIEFAKVLANSEVDLLIAPVWVPGVNDKDIPKIIEFALDIGAGKRWPPLGIQKYEEHRHGRRPPGVRPMRWRDFYRALRRWEEKYGVKLVLEPGDFGIKKDREVPKTMEVGEKVLVRVVAPGWRRGEVLGVARDRVVTVVSALGIPIGAEVRVRILRNKDNVYLARPEP